MVDEVMPEERNVTQKETKEIKYKSFCTQIKRMCNLKCVIIPAIIEATGIVKKWLKEKFGRHAGKIFSRFSTKDSYTVNITNNTESTAV
jgi:hypothetical protein